MPADEAVLYGIAPGQDRAHLQVSEGDFSGGLNVDVHPLDIGQNQTPDCLNMDFEEKMPGDSRTDGSFSKRLGYVKFNSTALPATPISSREFDTSDGTRRILAQTNTTVNITGPSTTTGSLLYTSPGTGTFTPVPWYNTGTCVFTNASSTVTSAGSTQFAANLDGAVSGYWIRAETATPSGWYRINAVASGANANITLDTNFTEATTGSVAYTIARPFAASTYVNFTQYKDNKIITQRSTRPQRYNGTVASFLEIIKPGSNPTYASSATAGTWDTSKTYQFVITYDHGTYGESVQTARISFTPGTASKAVDITSIPRGPDSVANCKVYSTLGEATSSGTAQLYLLTTQTNGTASATIANPPVSTAALLETDTAAVDVGNVAPVNAEFCYILGERLWLGGDPNNPSQISMSKVLYPGAFPSGNFIAINTEDGQVIQGLGESFGRLVVFKDESGYVLTSNTPYAQLEKIPSDLGCVSHKTVWNLREQLLRMTRRGVAAFDGTRDQIVSRAITPLVTGVKQAIQRLRYLLRTSYSEMNTGATLTNVDISNPDGDISITPKSQVWNTYAGFNNAISGSSPTFTNTSTGDGPGAVAQQPLVTLGRVTGSGPYLLRDLASSAVDGGTPVGTGSGWTNLSNANDGNEYTNAAVTFASNSGARTLTITFATGSWTVNYLYLKYSVTQSGSIRIDVDTKTGGTWTNRLTATQNPGGNVITEYLYGSFSPVSISDVRVVFTDISGGSVTTITARVFSLEAHDAAFVNTGTYQSQVIDTTQSGPTMGKFNATTTPRWFDANTAFSGSPTNDYGSTSAVTGNTAWASVVFSVRTGDVATPDSTWSAWTAQQVGDIFAAKVPLTGKWGRYFQWRGVITNYPGITMGRGTAESSMQSVTRTIDNVTVNYRLTATYVGAIIDMGAVPAKTGRFFYDFDLQGGIIQARVLMQASATPPAYSAMTNINSGDIVPGTLARYLAVGFQLDGGNGSAPGQDGFYSPLVHAYLAEWYQGTITSAAYPAVARVYNDRYYLSVESPQATANDTTFVMNRAGAWTKYDWAMNDYAISANTFYGASSNNSQVYYLLNGYDDDGTAIRSYLRTRVILSGANWKLFKRLFIMADAVPGANNTWTIWPNGIQANAFTLTLSGNTIGSLSSPTLLNSYGNNMGRRGFTPFGPGWSGGQALQQVDYAFGNDFRINHRGQHFFLYIFNNSANTAVLRFHRYELTYAARRVQGAAS